VEKSYFQKGRPWLLTFGSVDGARDFFARILLFAWLLCLLTPSLSVAESKSAPLKEDETIQASPKIPKEYGEVIYQINGEGSKQIYIIGIEHRNTITCYNGTNTVKVQAQAYRIGEWLVRNEGLSLLLPEGFFTRKTEEEALQVSPEEKNKRKKPELLDSANLEERLADNRTNVTAEILLKRNYGLRIRQVEDKFLYDVVHDAICKLSADEATPACNFLPLESRLQYLQEMRAASMLQKIPVVVDEEFQHGNIRNERALFTIGLSHLSQIIRYFNDKKIEIHHPLSAPSEEKDYVADLNLLKGKFGVTVIVPQKLADDDRVLKLCGVQKLIEQCRKQTSSVSSQKSP
jgi:hypothetical protein